MRLAITLTLLFSGLGCQQTQDAADSGAQTSDAGPPTYCTVSTSRGSMKGCDSPVIEVSSLAPDAVATVYLSAAYEFPYKPGGTSAYASIEWLGHIPDHMTEVDSPGSVSLSFYSTYQLCISYQACQTWDTTVRSEDGGTRLLPGASYTVNITSRVPTTCQGLGGSALCTALHGSIEGVLVPTVDGGIDRGNLSMVWTF